MFADTWKTCKNVLCLRPDNTGDVLMTTPAIRALKEAVPGRRIALLTSRAGSLVAPFIPEIDDVITFDVPWVKTNEAKGPEQVLELVGVLKERQFDAAVIFTAYSQNPLPTAMLCYLAGIKTVLGYCRENPYQLISDWVPDKEPLEHVMHEVKRQLRLVGTTGATYVDARLSFTIPAEARQAVQKRLSGLGLKAGSSWLVLHAGASEAKRLYPAKDYIIAGQKLIGEGRTILLTGGQDEREYTQAIAAGLGPSACSLAGELSLAELAALIEAAPVLVTNNTGPAHIAAAVGTPVVVLYAMTNPQHTPWQVPNRVLYFEVPPGLRSKNQLLKTFPGPDTPKASPQAIVQAVYELTEERRRG